MSAVAIMKTSGKSALWPGGRRPALMLLIGFCVFLALLGGRLLLAGVFAWQAEDFLKDWNRLGRVPSERAWEVGYQAAQRAVYFFPGANGDYLDRLGRILEARDSNLPLGAPEAEASRRAALEAYRDATRARPLWPYTWTQIAYVKLRLLEFDAEFDQAFARSFELAPWRIQSNALLAEIALRAWPSLDEHQREQGREAIRRSVDWDRRTARRMEHLAVGLGMQWTFCGALEAAQKEDTGICQG